MVIRVQPLLIISIHDGPPFRDKRGASASRIEGKASSILKLPGSQPTRPTKRVRWAEASSIPGPQSASKVVRPAKQVRWIDQQWQSQTQPAASLNYWAPLQDCIQEGPPSREAQRPASPATQAKKAKQQWKAQMLERRQERKQGEKQRKFEARLCAKLEEAQEAKERLKPKARAAPAPASADDLDAASRVVRA